MPLALGLKEGKLRVGQEECGNERELRTVGVRATRNEPGSGWSVDVLEIKQEVELG